MSLIFLRSGGSREYHAAPVKPAWVFTNHSTRGFRGAQQASPCSEAAARAWAGGSTTIGLSLWRFVIKKNALQEKSHLCIRFLVFWELRGLCPNFYIKMPVSDLFIPRNGPHISCSRKDKSIVQFLFWESLCQIFGIGSLQYIRKMNLWQFIFSVVISDRHSMTWIETKPFAA